MIRIGIVGCGKIADQHIAQINRIPDSEVVGVCDLEPMMAAQLADRIGLEAHFTDVDEMIEAAAPDVVHITTPPQSHFPLAELCLKHGCHVYVEKPFTIDAAQAQSLIDLASRRGLKLTVGHNVQFTHAANRMRKLIADGYMGGAPVHMESHYCYNLSDAVYAKALLGDPSHWVRTLPGGLLHNIISHGIAKIAELLQGDAPRVIAHGFTSPYLQSLGETQIIDELRVIIRDRDCATAYFTFSSQMRPILHQFRVYGPRNGILTDDDLQVLIKLRGGRLKSFLEPFLHPWIQAKGYAAGSLNNIRRFLGYRLHFDEAMKDLLQAFYRCIAEDGPVPIPYREILLTARIMDEIFVQVSTGQPPQEGEEGNKSNLVGASRTI